jgi:transcriptional regulator with XRE-family HTH domain
MQGRDIGRYLVRVRRTRMWTQGELAEEAGVSPTTVSGIESGKISRPHFGTLRKLARVLEIDPQDFFGDDPTDGGVRAARALTLEWARSTRDAEFERELDRASLEGLKRLVRQLDEERGRLQRHYGQLSSDSEERLSIKSELRHVAARSESVSTSILFRPEEDDQ